jgi:hypothetical protein
VLLPDLTLGVPSDGLEQLVADPELEKGVANQHVAGAAGIALAVDSLLS